MSRRKIMNETEVYIGQSVICDWGGEDYSASEAKGGIMFGSKACCPNCVEEVKAAAKKYNEEHFLGAECPLDMSFRDWVLAMRDGEDVIRIIEF